MKEEMDVYSVLDRIDPSEDAPWEVVGESHYNLVDLYKPKEGKGYCICDLLLVPEPDNPYDKNAIRVFHFDSETQNAKQVGYLKREDTSLYRRWMKRHGEGSSRLLTRGMITGFEDRYGVRIFLPMK